MGEVSAIVGDKSKLPRKATRSADTTFDKIWKYYFEPNKTIKLTPKEDDIRHRWEMAWLMDSTLLIRRKIVNRMMQKFDITERQGYKDINNARLLFSDPTAQNKEARRLIMSNLLEGMIRKAVAKDDFKSAERLIMRYEKLNGLHREENHELGEYLKKQKPAVIVFSTDPEILKKQADQLIEDVKDVDFEDIKES